MIIKTIVTGFSDFGILMLVVLFIIYTLIQLVCLIDVRNSPLVRCCKTIVRAKIILKVLMKLMELVNNDQFLLGY
ncbi:MAG: hypothetical protein IGNPGNKH_00702 [Sodalis sp. Ffu]|nr:MAG: hypothetical protein IGNPGNKH_00702 [Sodalis sp. Ffu]